MSLDAALIEQYTGGVAMPSEGQDGFLAVAVVNSLTRNFTFVDPRQLLLLPALGANLGDANATIQVSQGNARIVPPATLTANRQITLATTGATTGEVIDVYRRGTEAFTCAVINGGAGAGTKYTFPVSVARAARFKFDGTNWQLDSHWAI